MTRVKVSKKHQIAVPSEARRLLGIHAGDYLIVEVHDGMLVLQREPESHTQRLRGLHRAIWKDVDVDAYVRAERDAWKG